MIDFSLSDKEGLLTENKKVIGVNHYGELNRTVKKAVIDLSIIKKRDMI